MEKYLIIFGIMVLVVGILGVIGYSQFKNFCVDFQKNTEQSMQRMIDEAVDQIVEEMCALHKDSNEEQKLFIGDEQIR